MPDKLLNEIINVIGFPFEYDSTCVICGKEILKCEHGVIGIDSKKCLMFSCNNEKCNRFFKSYVKFDIKTRKIVSQININTDV